MPEVVFNPVPWLGGYGCGLLIAVAIVAMTHDDCLGDGKQRTMIQKAARFGAAFLWPVTLPALIVLCCSAFAFYTPVAIVKIWRKIRAEVLSEAETLESGKVKP